MIESIFSSHSHNNSLSWVSVDDNNIQSK